MSALQDQAPTQMLSDLASAYREYQESLAAVNSSGAPDANIADHITTLRQTVQILELLQVERRRANDLSRQLWLIDFVAAVRSGKRGRGRPTASRTSLSSLALPEWRKGKRQRTKYSDDFLATLLSRVEWRTATAAESGQPIHHKEALRQELNEYLSESVSDSSERAPRVETLLVRWEPLLSRYRTKVGKPIYSKLQLPPKLPNFSPLEQFWPNPRLPHVNHTPSTAKAKHGYPKSTDSSEPE